MFALLLVSVLLVIGNVVSAQEQDLIDNTDITFVIDSSGSVGASHYQLIRKFIEDIVQEMNIGESDSRVAVIIFTSGTTLYFNLNRYTVKKSLVLAVRAIPYYGGGTDIPAALDRLRFSALNGVLGIRNISRQVAIFLTDGEGGTIAPSAERLAETNIFEVFTVGVASARVDQLNLISQSAELVYYHDVFTAHSLVTIAQQIVERLKEKNIAIQPRFGSTLGGTVIQVIGSNLRFNNYHFYTCLFGDKEVPCAYIESLGHIICTSPPLRQQGRVNFCLSISSSPNTAGSQYCDQFFPLIAEEDTEVYYEDVMISPGDEITIRWSQDSILPQSLQEPLLGTEQFSVDLSFYMIDDDPENITFIAKIATEIRNSGIYQVMIEEMDMIQDYAGGVIGVSPSEQFVTRRGITDVLKKIVGNVVKWGTVVVITSTRTTAIARRALCEAWILSQPDDIGNQILNRVPPCPPTKQQAVKDNNFDEEDHSFISGAASCFQQRDFIPSNEGSGQQCCYDSNNNLVIGPDSGGSVDLYSNKENWWKHTIHDVIPFILCCRSLFSNCQTYYDIRPSQNGTGYNTRPCGRGAGDPHIFTLDGLKYTFNGRGEFVLLEHVDDVFVLQGRMENIIGQMPISATVFTAVAGKQNSSDTVQFEINQQFNGIDVIVAGELIDMEGLYEISFNNVRVFNFGSNTYAARFSTGCFVQVKEENGFISVLTVALPDSFKGYTRGLMGNYNGDMTDDLMPSSSTIPLHHNASLDDIHYQFGVTWLNSNTSTIFTYNEKIGQSWNSFYRRYYRPSFSFNTNNLILESVCGNDTFCMFDVASTGSTEIGLSTLNSSREYEEILELLRPIICDPPCEQGACVANDTCNCMMGYVGERCTEAVYEDCNTDVEVCANGGVCRKLGSSYICECPDGYTGLSCQTEIEDSDNATLIIVLVVIFFILLILTTAVVVFFCYRRRRSLRKSYK